MSLINMAKREINCKIVYYGIGLCGKTTNLHYIHKAVNQQDVGDMVSIDTETERTLYFDLLPLEPEDVLASASGIDGQQDESSKMLHSPRGPE